MKKISLVLCLLLTIYRCSAQNTLQDSIINARDYLAGALISAYLNDIEKFDQNVRESDKKFFDTVKKLLFTNSFRQPISNKELNYILINNYFKSIANRFLPNVERINIIATTEREYIPKLIEQKLYEIDSNIARSVSCVALKDIFRIQLDIYFNIYNKETISLMDSIRNAKNYIASKLMYINLVDFISFDTTATDSDKFNFSKVRSYFESNTVEQPNNIDTLISLLQNNGYAKFTILLLPNVRDIDPDIDDISSRKDIASILINRFYEFPGRALNCTSCKSIKDSLRRELENYFEIKAPNIFSLVKIDSTVLYSPNTKRINSSKTKVIVFLALLVIITSAIIFWVIVKRRRARITRTRYIRRREYAIEEPNLLIENPPARSHIASVPVKMNPGLKSKPVNFYMEFPEQDFFPEQLKTLNRIPKKSIFEFSYVNEKEAEFSVLSDNDISALFRNPVHIEKLRFACNYSSFPTTKTLHINTITKGLVGFVDNKWEVVIKAWIVFIQDETKSATNQKDAKQAQYIKNQAGNNVSSAIQVPPQNIKLDETERLSTIFYMSLPDGRIFLNASKSLNANPFTYFKFFQEENKNTARFKIINNDELKKTVLNRQLHKMASACDYPSDYSDDILDIEYGEASLIEGNWKITKKSKIIFA